MARDAAVAAAGRMDGNERRVVAFSSIAHGLDHIPDLTYAALIAIFLTAFATDTTALGAIATAFAIAGGLTAPLGGWLSDRMGSHRMLVVFLVLSGLASFLVATSVSLAMLAATMVVLGLAIGLYHPVGLSYITRGVRARSMAIGYHGMAGNLGVAIAPAMTAAIVAVASWRMAWVALGALFLVMAVVAALTPVEEKQSREMDATRDPQGRTYQGLRVFLLPLLAIFGVNILGGFIYRGALTFLPLHLGEAVRLDWLPLLPAATGGAFATLALAFSIPGQYVGGWLGERIRRENALPAMAAAIVPFLVLMSATGGLALVAAASAFAFFNFMAQPLYTALVADYSPPRHQGSVFGVSFLTSFAIGASAATVAGYVADVWGTGRVFLVMAGVQAVILALSTYVFLAAARRGRRRTDVPAAG